MDTRNEADSGFLKSEREAMKTRHEMIDVGSGNIDKTGFFCYMSKKKTEGYQRKSAWLKARFAEGLQIEVDATQAAMAAAEKAGVRCRIVDLQTRDDLLRISPSAYGVFSLVLDSTLLGYHYQLEKDLIPLLKQIDEGDADLRAR